MKPKNLQKIAVVVGEPVQWATICQAGSVVRRAVLVAVQVAFLVVWVSTEGPWKGIGILGYAAAVVLVAAVDGAVVLAAGGERLHIVRRWSFRGAPATTLATASPGEVVLTKRGRWAERWSIGGHPVGIAARYGGLIEAWRDTPRIP